MLKIALTRRHILDMVECLEKLVKPVKKPAKVQVSGVADGEQTYVLGHGWQFSETSDAEVEVPDLCMSCGEDKRQHRMSCQLYRLYQMWDDVEKATRVQPK